MGLTLTWLSIIVLIPLAGLFLKTFELSFDQFWTIITSRRTLHALKLSFGLAFLAALVNLAIGMIVVWALVRYRFPGRRLFDAIVDIPFALPTAVAGVALTQLFAQKGWLGAPLAELGIKVAFTPAGIFVAMVFIGIPFVVRTVQPVLLGSRRRDRRSRGKPRCQSLAHRYQGDPARLDPGDADRFRTGLCARRRRIRLGDFHCRQPAQCLRDRAAPDRDPAVGIPLRRRHRDCGCHAGRRVPDHLRRQPHPAPGTNPHPGVVRVSRMRIPRKDRHSGARAQRASPESITPIGGYGFRACAQEGASRNDEGEAK
jgi:hypothetical protein